jgi:hypothetical protein
LVATLVAGRSIWLLVAYFSCWSLNLIAGRSIWLLVAQCCC